MTAVARLYTLWTGMNACNPDYRGPLLCRFDYFGASACTRRTTPHVDPLAPPGWPQEPGRMRCLMDIPVTVKRDWIILREG